MARHVKRESFLTLQAAHRQHVAPGGSAETSGMPGSKLSHGLAEPGSQLLHRQPVTHSAGRGSQSLGLESMIVPNPQTMQIAQRHFETACFGLSSCFRLCLDSKSGWPKPDLLRDLRRAAYEMSGSPLSWGVPGFDVMVDDELQLRSQSHRRF